MTDVIMPQMGESIAEGTITKWYKKVGEITSSGTRPLFEISTDKVDTEIPAPVVGRPESEMQGASEGETVPINTVIARDRRVSFQRRAPAAIRRDRQRSERQLRLRPRPRAT